MQYSLILNENPFHSWFHMDFDSFSTTKKVRLSTFSSSHECLQSAVWSIATREDGVKESITFNIGALISILLLELYFLLKLIGCDEGADDSAQVSILEHFPPSPSANLTWISTSATRSILFFSSTHPSNARIIREADLTLGNILSEIPPSGGKPACDKTYHICYQIFNTSRSVVNFTS